MLVSAPAQAQAAAPATTANKLFDAWLANDRYTAGKVATPAAVDTIFAYVFRAPDKFAGCKGKVCRFVHTSVKVPGGLNGILMIVSGSKVTKVYQSRHFAKPTLAAQHFYKGWQYTNRYRALEAGSEKAVKQLFKYKGSPTGMNHTYQGCFKEPKGYACSWTYEGGAISLHMRGSKAAGYAVSSVSLIAD